jgi:hypothetical protein
MDNTMHSEMSAGAAAAGAAAKSVAVAAGSPVAVAVGGGIGAAIVMCLRLPKSRTEMFLMLVVAFGMSIPLAPVVLRTADTYLESFSLRDYTTFEVDMLFGLTSAIIGSLSWGLFSLILNFRDRAVRAPEDTASTFLQALRELKTGSSLGEARSSATPRGMAPLAPTTVGGQGNAGKFD